MFDDELNEMDTTALITLEQDEKDDNPVHQKVQKELKRYASYLGICLYFSVIVIFLLLAVTTYFLPMYADSLSAIGYPIFNQCLYSLMLWSIPIIAMYIGKPWSPLFIFVSIFGELLRILISYQNYLDVFSSNEIATEIKGFFLIIEILRYVVLYSCCKRIFKSKLLKQNMRGMFQKKRQ